MYEQFRFFKNLLAYHLDNDQIFEFYKENVNQNEFSDRSSD